MFGLETHDAFSFDSRNGQKGQIGNKRQQVRLFFLTSRAWNSLLHR